ncbi:MAG: TRAP transporter small permease [Elusimicrobiota bacterium]|jgi:TRAP-type C4-dicarboxylate transport system permease small subunit|nr:TRAP transporter small permease [Elusimicrobiota bacterium]
MNNSILKALQKIENIFLIVIFAIMIISAFAQVVNRNIIGASISWFEELARYCMVYMTLIATELGLRDGTQITITAFTAKLSPNLRKALSIFAKLVVIVFAAIVFIYSFPLLAKQISFGQVSPGLQLPMYIPYFGVTLSFGIIAIVQTSILIIMIRGFFINENASAIKEAK